MKALKDKMVHEEHGRCKLTRESKKPPRFFIYMSIIGLIACISYFFLNNGEILIFDISHKYPDYRSALESAQDSNTKWHFVLGVLTIPSHKDLRNAQRKTWISALQGIAQHKVSVRFLIDNPTDDMLEEHRKYKDIVFLNSSHVGRADHFGEKMYLWFFYAYHNFPSANVIGKMDDDVFLCIPQILSRIESFYNQTLYYGWAHKHHRNVTNVTLKDRVDEMFVVLGRKLVERIVQRRYCPYKKGCVIKTDLMDTNYGGTSIGLWLSTYNDIRFVADNQKIVHSANGLITSENVHVEFVNNPNFCSNHLLCHKVNSSQMEIMQNYNKIPHSEARRVIFSENENNYVAFGQNQSSTYRAKKIFSGSIFRDIPKFAYRNKVLVNGTHPKHCEKWAVVTTIFKPSQSVINIADNDEWCLVVIADLSSLSEKDYLTGIGKVPRNFFYLTPTKQSEMYPSLSGVIPWNTFQRKNIGYIFAIHGGAKYIWDFDDDNDGIIDLHYFDNNAFLYKTPCLDYADSVLNPYPYFGVNESFTWPRGFPLTEVTNINLVPSLCDSSLPVDIGIIQSLANIQPDVDAIYRLTRFTPFNFSTKPDTFPPVIIPNGVYVPINSQASLWIETSFSWIAHPVSVHPRIADIWRGYFAEFFLYKENIRTVFVPPYVNQFRNPHDYLADFNDEMDIYHKSKMLVNFLSNYDSSKNIHGIQKLYDELYKRGYIDYIDLEFISIWIETFEKVNNL